MNSWKAILFGKPWRQIRIPSRTPLHFNWSNTRWESILPACNEKFHLQLKAVDLWNWKLSLHPEKTRIRHWKTTLSKVITAFRNWSFLSYKWAYTKVFMQLCLNRVNIIYFLQNIIYNIQKILLFTIFISHKPKFNLWNNQHIRTRFSWLGIIQRTKFALVFDNTSMSLVSCSYIGRIKIVKIQESPLTQTTKITYYQHTYYVRTYLV